MPPPTLRRAASNCRAAEVPAFGVAAAAQMLVAVRLVLLLLLLRLLRLVPAAAGIWQAMVKGSKRQVRVRVPTPAPTPMGSRV